MLFWRFKKKGRHLISLQGLRAVLKAWKHPDQGRFSWEMAFSCQQLPHNPYNERPVKFRYKLFARCFTKDNSLNWNILNLMLEKKLRRHLDISSMEFLLQVVTPWQCCSWHFFFKGPTWRKSKIPFIESLAVSTGMDLSASRSTFLGGVKRSAQRVSSAVQRERGRAPTTHVPSKTLSQTSSTRFAKTGN
jgi:hypothetical protein